MKRALLIPALLALAAPIQAQDPAPMAPHPFDMAPEALAARVIEVYGKRKDYACTIEAELPLGIVTRRMSSTFELAGKKVRIDGVSSVGPRKERSIFLADGARGLMILPEKKEHCAAGPQVPSTLPAEVFLHALLTDAKGLFARLKPKGVQLQYHKGIPKGFGLIVQDASGIVTVNLDFDGTNYALIEVVQETRFDAKDPNQAPLAEQLKHLGIEKLVLKARFKDIKVDAGIAPERFSLDAPPDSRDTGAAVAPKRAQPEPAPENRPGAPPAEPRPPG